MYRNFQIYIWWKANPAWWHTCRSTQSYVLFSFPLLTHFIIISWGWKTMIKWMHSCSKCALFLPLGLSLANSIILLAGWGFVRAFSLTCFPSLPSCHSFRLNWRALWLRVVEEFGDLVFQIEIRLFIQQSCEIEIVVHPLCNWKTGIVNTYSGLSCYVSLMTTFRIRLWLIST